EVRTSPRVSRDRRVGQEGEMIFPARGIEAASAAARILCERLPGVARSLDDVDEGRMVQVRMVAVSPDSERASPQDGDVVRLRRIRDGPPMGRDALVQGVQVGRVAVLIDFVEVRVLHRNDDELVEGGRGSRTGGVPRRNADQDQEDDDLRDEKQVFEPLHPRAQRRPSPDRRVPALRFSWGRRPTVTLRDTTFTPLGPTRPWRVNCGPPMDSEGQCWTEPPYSARILSRPVSPQSHYNSLRITNGGRCSRCVAGPHPFRRIGPRDRRFVYPPSAVTKRICCPPSPGAA